MTRMTQRCYKNGYPQQIKCMYEFFIIDEILHGAKTLAEIETRLKSEIIGFCEEQLKHAVFHMQKSKIISEAEPYTLTAPVDDQFIEHVEDLIHYGITKYDADYGEETCFLLWHNYGMSQVQLKLLKDPGYNQLGTYVYGKQVVIFASLKKDASVEERLNYKDKFLEPTLFQWECENNIRDSKLQGLIESD